MVELVQPLLTRGVPATDKIVYSELRQQRLVVEVEQVKGIVVVLMGAPAAAAAAATTAARGRKEGMAAGVTIIREEEVAEVEHQVKTEGTVALELVGTVETERPTRGVT